MEPASSVEATRWYFVARNGDLAARICPGLRLGEDPFGELSLHAADALIQCDIAIDGSLILSTALGGCRFGLAGGERTRIVHLNRGDSARIRLFNNSLSLATDFAPTNPPTPPLCIELVSDAQGTFAADREKPHDARDQASPLSLVTDSQPAEQPQIGRMVAPAKPAAPKTSEYREARPAPPSRSNALTRRDVSARTTVLLGVSITLLAMVALLSYRSEAPPPSASTIPVAPSAPADRNTETEYPTKLYADPGPGPHGPILVDENTPTSDALPTNKDLAPDLAAEIQIADPGPEAILDKPIAEQAPAETPALAVPAIVPEIQLGDAAPAAIDVTEVTLPDPGTLAADPEPQSEAQEATPATETGSASPDSGKPAVYPISQLTVINMEAPEYPRRAPYGAQASFDIELIVSAAGDVSVVAVRGDPPSYFERAARRAILKWKFEPVAKDGKRIPVRTSVTVSFRS